MISNSFSIKIIIVESNKKKKIDTRWVDRSIDRGIEGESRWSSLVRILPFSFAALFRELESDQPRATVSVFLETRLRSKLPSARRIKGTWGEWKNS